MSKITAEDVRDVLAALGNEFLVDIPATHEDGQSLVSYGELEYALTAPRDEWVDEIADYANLIRGEQ